MATDYSMELTKIATGIVANIIGIKSFNTYNSSDGNSIIMEFDGYPIYGTENSGKVFFQLPRSTFYMRGGDVKINPIQQAQCKYYQINIGEQFAHPHIYSDGHPCWDKGRRDKAADIIANIIETLTLENVTENSVLKGRCASRVMQTGLVALENAKKQESRVFLTFKSEDKVQKMIQNKIKNKRELDSYVNKLWCNKITIYKKCNVRGGI